MANRHLHTHPCATCGERFECSGVEWFNYDGEPEVVCTHYHEEGWQECEACAQTVTLPAANQRFKEETGSEL